MPKYIAEYASKGKTPYRIEVTAKSIEEVRERLGSWELAKVYDPMEVWKRFNDCHCHCGRDPQDCTYYKLARLTDDIIEIKLIGALLYSAALHLTKAAITLRGHADVKELINDIFLYSWGKFRQSSSFNRDLEATREDLLIDTRNKINEERHGPITVTGQEGEA